MSSEYHEEAWIDAREGRGDKDAAIARLEAESERLKNLCGELEGLLTTAHICGDKLAARTKSDAATIASLKAEVERWAAQALKEDECRRAWQARAEASEALNEKLRAALEACERYMWFVLRRLAEIAPDEEAKPEVNQAFQEYVRARAALQSSPDNGETR